MRILVLNVGSSSLKSCIFELAHGLPELPPEPTWQAHIDWSKGPRTGKLSVRSSQGLSATKKRLTNARAVIRSMLESLWSGSTKVVGGPAEIDIVGHRVVHGGHDYQHATRITAKVKATIARLAVLAPVHNRADLIGIETVEQVFGDVPQVAVFDTAFHSQLPPAAAIYPIPYEWYERGIRRYGFHGISHRYCAERTAQVLGRALKSLRLITCHLGNGCSLAAIRYGRSVDTTMGFTPLEGLMMGNRSGSIDPGILTYWLRKRAYSADQLEQVLNQRSGLLGVSGVGSDMRQVLAAVAQGHRRAKLAFDVYVHRLRSYLGAMLATLGRLDAVAFTGGVGENCAALRAAACQPFQFLGLRLDASKNAKSPADEDVAAADSSVRAVVVRAREEWAIARECWALARRRTARLRSS